jgi:hypothetical protein
MTAGAVLAGLYGGRLRNAHQVEALTISVNRPV